MLELLANPPWWVLLILSIVLPKLSDEIWRRLPRWMDHAKGALRRRLRAWRLKQLLAIKSRRFDSVEINRVVVRSYAYLVLFVSCAVTYGLGLVLIPEAMRRTDGGVMFWGVATGLPMIAFELAWLRTSNKVDDLLKHRKKIKPHGRRLC
ncbi:hypothetical protein CXK96_16985 [Stutzerimonas stutzeri]|nr:hypothetical protein CXK96_16985 [Stutzerimonas stutzeri]